MTNPFPILVTLEQNHEHNLNWFALNRVMEMEQTQNSEVCLTEFKDLTWQIFRTAQEGNLLLDSFFVLCDYLIWLPHNTILSCLHICEMSMVFKLQIFFFSVILHLKGHLQCFIVSSVMLSFSLRNLNKYSLKITIFFI